jgi:ribonuclease Z
MFKEKSPELNVDKFKITKYGLSIAQIVAAKRGEDVMLEDGITIANSELTYLPFEPKSYAYLSDTARSAVAARRVKGVTMLYHEATYTKEVAKDAKARGHSTAADAAGIAVAAEAQRLIIGHFSSRYKSPEVLLNEAKEIFENTLLAEEGTTYTV